MHIRIRIKDLVDFISLVSNALKYAFPDGTGTVIICLQHCSGHIYELIIQDNGIGMPKSLDIDHLDSLGLQLVKGLVEEQLDGTLELQQNISGTRWMIRFPAVHQQKNDSSHPKEQTI